MFFKTLILCALLLGVAKCVYRPCHLREYTDGFVCVCNETYCDTMDVEKPQKFGEYVLITSTKAGQRFAVTKGKFTPSKQSIEDNQQKNLSIFSLNLKINREKQYQKIVGFGGAFHGTVSYLVDLMPPALRNSFYRNYYARDEGIAYNMMRIPIGGCDFDFAPWAYNELPANDAKLDNFTRLDRRDLRRIEQINELKRVAKIDDIKLMGAAWSPPKWMKSNGDWTGYSSLKPEYYRTWAEYHLKYLRLMAEQNMTYWGISTGNEPLNGIILWMFVHFMSLGWTPKNQGKWVGEHLGPMLHNSEFRNVKLFAGDDQRYTIPIWIDHMKRGSPKSIDFISGIAFHWYADQFLPPSFIDVAYKKYPNMILLNTESTLGDKPWEKHRPILGLWSRAETYALRIIDDLQHHVAGWIDWGLLLDENGGPNYVNNTVEAPIILNTTTNNEFYKQPIFYVLGHLSKFLPPGSIRIDSKLSGFQSRKIKVVAFFCPDKTVSIILYNQYNRQRSVKFTDKSRGSVTIELEPKSITSFVFA